MYIDAITSKRTKQTSYVVKGDDHKRIAEFVTEALAQAYIDRQTAAAEQPAPITSAPTPMRDRRAAAVGDMLGRSTPATGRCHYCGLPLNRNGYCDECV